MTEALEHLEDALESVQDARDEANLGTAMMIKEVEEEIQALIGRTERLEDEE